MLLALTGSSCSGKTTIAERCVDIDGVVVHESDELGVPSSADLRWRQRTTEEWVQRTLTYEQRGLSVLLTGQAPLGEILACPSSPQLQGITVCLLDVPDEERLRRLNHRDPGRWDESSQQAFLGWARWHREHAADPRARPDVITSGGWDRMRWERWQDWTRHDPRWRTTVLDTAAQSIEETTCAVQS